MENQQASALKKISSQINTRYRQFLAIEPADPKQMPSDQLNYFIDQALSRHYHVTLHLNMVTVDGDEEPMMTGYLTKGPKDSFIVTESGQKITQLVRLNQIKFVERTDYR